MNKFNGLAKPLASKRGQKLFPICYVDSSIRTAGNPLRSSDCVVVTKAAPEEDEDDLKHQMPQACSQWGNALEKAKESWLKSWYFPIDVFNPWPIKTDICCWWCTYSYDWTPFPLPYHYDLSSNRYKSIGMFCGPSCSKSYACKVKGYSNLDSVYSFIETVAEDFYGYNMHMDDGAPKRSSIPLAPDKEVLQRYCGEEGMTIEQFRAACACGRNIKLLPPSWITTKQIVQAEQQVAKKGCCKIYHRENPDDIQRTQDLVRIHRIPFAGRGARRMSYYLSQKS